MKKILRQYIFTIAFILCLTSFFIGIITVKEKTRYNMDMTPYSTVSITETEKGITVSFGEKEHFISRENIEKLGKKALYGAMGDVFVRLGNILEKNAS